ncbi:MAG: CBS domain-containing protein [Candidatus Yanofskybacteria bacterium]|nr:CBS domain-containing protein [Candidatus Yanofskybacteria bacterium]
MVELAKVKDIMTTQVLSINAEDTLDVVAQLFEKYDYDGMPVVDNNHKLLGIITAYDMVIQSSGMHLPTVLNIMDKIAVNQADRQDLDKHFSKLREIKASAIMNAKPLTVTPELGITDAAKLFAEHHRVNPLIVVDEAGLLVGVVSRYDIIRFFNEKYFKNVVQQATPGKDPFKEIAQTKSEKEVESAVGELSEEFLLVTKKRPRIWKYAAIAMFIAGLMVATALIIRIVQQQG